MLHFDFTNFMADAVGESDGITQDDIKQLGLLAQSAHQRFMQWRSKKDAVFYDIVFDDELADGIAEKAKKVAARFENVVVLGIGGSALGLRCMAQTLLPPFWNIMAKGQRAGLPRLFVCDNVDPETFSGLLKFVDIKNTCFVAISKSGRTTETAAQLWVVLSRLRDSLGNDWREHLVVITDSQSGDFRSLAQKESLTSFAIPRELGGRYSVLSPVGLFPAACVGIDIEGLISGARAMANRCQTKEIGDNPAYQIGGYHYWLETRKGKRLSVMMPYSDAFLLAADWYAQLWAESLGKDGKGQTPVKALGATDQHSQLQLFMDGPKDKVFTFVGTESFRVPPEDTRIEKAEGSFSYLIGHDLGSIIKAEQTSTTMALAEAGRPSLTITFPSIDAHHLGEFFMVYEIATAFAGALYGVNPFDQPGVERGKELTREMLRRTPKTPASHPLPR